MGSRTPAGKPLSNRYLYTTSSTTGTTEFQFANALTLAPGSNATVVNLGTSTAPILQFGIPQGQPGSLGNLAEVTVGNLYAANVTVSGLLASNVAAGPRIVQGPWDAPGNAHVIPWLQLASGAETATGQLHVHASSRDRNKKNGMATLTLCKDAGDPPDVMIAAVHTSSNLQTFDVVVLPGYDLHVETDPECSVCWNFVGGVG